MLRELAELTDARRGRPAVVPRARLRERGAGDRRAGDRPRQAHRRRSSRRSRASARAPPRRSASCSRPGKVDEARGAAREAPARAWSRCCASRGSGPKALAQLRAELGVRVDRRPARARSPSTGCASSRASARSPRRSSPQALARLDAQGAVDRTPISVALPLATRIVARLREVPGVTHAVVLRLAAPLLPRRSATSTSWWRRATPAPVMEALVAMSFVERVLGRGESKTSVVTQRGTQVDLRVVAAHQLGAALLYFTGSKGHNIKLRQRALARGLTLNEYALSEIEGGARRRERDRGADLRGARPAAGSRRCCARTRARSRPPRTARCRGRSAT